MTEDKTKQEKDSSKDTQKKDEYIIVMIGSQYSYKQHVYLPVCRKSIDITIAYLKKLRKSYR